MSSEGFQSVHLWTRPNSLFVTGVNSMENKHHILFNRQEWTLRPQAERLRETSELVPSIDVDLHNYIHRNSTAIPLLGHHALDYVSNSFKPVDGDTLASLDSLMETIESSGTHWRAHPIEQELGELAVRALEIQRHLLEGEI